MDQRRAELRAGCLFLDCFSGIAGDMFLGAVLDLGMPREVLESGLALLPVQGYRLNIGRRQHLGIAGHDLRVELDDHQERHHPHRRFSTVRKMISESELSAKVKERALDIFQRVAVAEGKLHQMPPDEVMLHEVGAIDSIVDIVGAAICLDYLEPKRVVCRPIPLGSGFTRCAHGRMPVPAPATLEILAGLPVVDGGASIELCTPTGAAIAASIVSEFGGLPAGDVIAIGYGAGDKELADRPNHLRLIVLREESAHSEVVVLETNLDDMNPEWYGHLSERLFEAGARDVWFTPIVMKKGRPAHTLSLLCDVARRTQMEQLIFAETTAIGLRSYAVERRTVARESVEVESEYGTLVLKIARDGDNVLNAAPEYEVCKRAAQRQGNHLSVEPGSTCRIHR